jgi:hypothetical protein
MHRTILNKLLHPKVAIHQGLPSSNIGADFSNYDYQSDISKASAEKLESYLDDIVESHSNAKEDIQRNSIYADMGIIDSKAQSMLSFNSFLLAIVGIYFGTLQSLVGQIFILIPFIMTFAVSITSCLFCLNVVWVHWSTGIDKTKGDGVNEEILELLYLRDERTIQYRKAWILSYLAVLFLFLGIVITIIIGLLEGSNVI